MSAYKAQSFLLRPLWFAAGGDPYLLKRGTYSDQVKIACLGGTVYATSVLAFFSGSYAIHTVFAENVEDPIAWKFWVMGFIWSLIIFNLDRFIVASTPPIKAETGFWPKIFNAPFITRMLLGFIIGLVIATPLKIKIFEKDIQKEILSRMDADREKRIKEKEDLNHDELLAFEIRIEEFNKEIESLTKKISSREEEYGAEISGKHSGSKGIGEIARGLKAEENKFRSQHDWIEKKRDSVKQEKEAFRKKEIVDEVEKDSEIAIRGFNSLVSKAAIPFQINLIVALFIVAFFLAIELTPIVLKTFMEASPYDNQKLDRDKLIVNISEEDKRNSESVLIKKSIIGKEIEEAKLDERKRQSDAKIGVEKESFDGSMNSYKSALDAHHKAVIEKGEMEKFNEMYNQEEEQLYLSNLKKQKSYIDQLTAMHLERLDKDNFSWSEVEKLNVQRLLVQKEIELVQKKELDKIKALDTLIDPNGLMGFNPQEEYDKRKNKVLTGLNHSSSNGTSINRSSVESQTLIERIEDGLIPGRTYQAGDSYSKARILTLGEILNIVGKENEEKARVWHNSDENMVITDSKITQIKKNMNIYEAVKRYKSSMLDNGNTPIGFDVERAKSLVNGLKKRIYETL